MDVDAEEELNNGTKTSRKRIRRPETCKRNVKKRKVNCGETYISESLLLVPERKVKKPCSDKCRFKCSKKIVESEREDIFKAFWNLGNRTRQRDYISKICFKTKSKYPRYKIERSKIRRSNIAYNFNKHNELIRVCQLFFMNTLCIGNTMLRNIFKDTDKYGHVQEDKRGKHKNHPVVDENIKNEIRNHIESLSVIESHYLRKQTTRKFVDGSLNLSILYRMYKDQCVENGKNFAKKNIYETIFNTEYNIGFFKPKKDQCSVCEEYKNSSTEEKVKKEKFYNVHIENKNLVRIEKLEDVQKSRNDASRKVVCCYDLQAVFATPSGQVSSFFYKSRLNTINFTIYDITNKLGFSYLWHEGVANRGPNEIGTCVFDFLKTHCQHKEVIFYSDNCYGQNKNKHIVATYIHAVNTLDIPKITHKYLIAGHTQNEGDSMHSCIEKEKARILRGGPIYTPYQFSSIIKSAKKTGKPYTVKEISTVDIKDFKKLTDEIGENFTIDNDKQKIKWSTIKIIQVEKGKKAIFKCKTDYKQKEFKIIYLKKNGRPRKSLILHNAYKKPPTISSKKYEDLLSLCKSNVIPQVHHNFYESLRSDKEISTKTQKRKRKIIQNNNKINKTKNK